MKRLHAIFTLVCLAAMPSLGWTAPYHVFLESDTDAGAGAEVFLAEFATYPDLLSSTLSGTSFSQLNIGANFSMGGVTQDASGFHVMLERNADAGAGAEIFLANFASYDDLLSGSLSSAGFSQLNVGANFSVGGFTYDGSAYQVLLERDLDAGAGAEIFLATFTTFADLLSSNLAAAQFLPLNVGANFSVGGFTFDAGSYRLMLERDANAGAGAEIFMVTYASLADFLTNNIGEAGFSQLDVGTNFSVGGLLAEAQVTPPDNSIPAPGTLALLMPALWLLVRKRRS